MKKVVSIALALAVAAGLAANTAATGAAAATQRLILEFVQGSELSVAEADGTRLVYGADLREGDPIPVGGIIRTGADTSAELRLDPNGSIMKLAAQGTFSVKNLATVSSPQNAFTLISGKIRAVLARDSGQSYTFSTATAVLAVRGTEFLLSFLPGRDASVFVKSGAVEFEKLDAEGKAVATIGVSASQQANAFASDFRAQPATPAEIAIFNRQNQFQKLDPRSVPGHEPDGPPPQGDSPTPMLPPPAGSGALKNGAPGGNGPGVPGGKM